jgi:prepilin-type N-terminal cleavage/methylation domain-containing protein
MMKLTHDRQGQGRVRGRRSVCGFTLVELLVVIAIIGVLVALLLPAIQAAREAARRASCNNNLKNIALAVLNYESTNKVFPTGEGWDKSDDPNAGEEQNVVDALITTGYKLSGKSWILTILPQLEQGPLYDRFAAGGAFDHLGPFRTGLINNPKPGFGLTSRSADGSIRVPELMKTQLPVLQCPSDESVREFNTNHWQWSLLAGGVARTSYLGVADDTWLEHFDPFHNNNSPYPSGIYEENPTLRDCHRGTRCRGIFFRNTWLTPIKIASITDGTSHTYMIGEDVPIYNRHNAAFYSNGDWSSCNLPLNYLINLEPEERDWWEEQGFRSLHPGGVQFAACDGSVRYVADSSDSTAFRVGCTRNGAEIVGESL